MYMHMLWRVPRGPNDANVTCQGAIGTTVRRYVRGPPDEALDSLMSTMMTWHKFDEDLWLRCFFMQRAYCIFSLLVFHRFYSKSDLLSKIE